MGQLDGRNRLGQRADLVDLDENAIGDVLVDAAPASARCCHEQIVADELDLLPSFC